MFVCCVACCQRSLRRADHSSRGILPTVVRRCVWSRKTSRMRKPWPALGRSATNIYIYSCVVWEVKINTCLINVTIKCLNDVCHRRDASRPAGLQETSCCRRASAVTLAVTLCQTSREQERTYVAPGPF